MNVTQHFAMAACWPQCLSPAFPVSGRARTVFGGTQIHTAGSSETGTAYRPPSPPPIAVSDTKYAVESLRYIGYNVGAQKLYSQSYSPRTGANMTITIASQKRTVSIN